MGNKYIVVYVDAGISYLAVWVQGAETYEAVASGKVNELKRLAEELNSKDQ